MKNILVVDGALNCAYDIFQSEDDDFRILFPKQGQDIQFAEDVENDPVAISSLERLWKRPISKKSVRGIHGILFFNLSEKKEFYPTRQDSDLDLVGRAFSTKNL